MSQVHSNSTLGLASLKHRSILEQGRVLLNLVFQQCLCG